MTNTEKLYLELSMLSIFRSILNKPLFSHFMDYSVADILPSKINCYAAMVYEIYRGTGSLTELVRRIVFEDENVYIKMRAAGKEVPTVIAEATEHELSVISRFASLKNEDFLTELKAHGNFDYLSPFMSESCDLKAEYESRVKNIAKYGYGIFSSYPMFCINGDGEISPILSYDGVDLDRFIGYESERASVLENTRAFLDGKSAANVLLYGDAGTGKSSTVKAAVNHFYADGLRLIEIRKDQISFLPYIMGRIVDNPLKFIIFIDDLSFNKNDDNFSMLKAALEGSASAKADNALIYATSNRRHIVKETFNDREGGDVHRNDTMQEKLSLSERFGLSVCFGKPNKQLYLEIVHELATRCGIDIDIAILDMKAEEFALRRGNRSPRCAEQFIKTIL